ncbi:TatD family hydrolase [Paenibacillus sp. FSL W8-0426]|uniref:TatD family hydrolase n=1 Tax=Paenibacillus sp. FSL W8-0426 TaxID=2921714 RepID=UPI0030DB18D7
MKMPTHVPFIDAHLHLDQYTPAEQQDMLRSLPSHQVEAVIAVSMHLASSQATMDLAARHPHAVFPAIGFHPEQPLPSPSEAEQLFDWIERRIDQAVAIGEVGLPYYSRQEAEQAGKPWDQSGYVLLLERFVRLAKKHDKPIVLHAVYEDADVACDLLEQYQVNKAHFHWFKGSPETIRRMADNGYYVSFTPDIVYEEEIQALARVYPPGQIMAETDGPWPFEGPFAGRMTHPAMTSRVVQAWCEITGTEPEAAVRIFYENTKRFYRLP